MKKDLEWRKFDLVFRIDKNNFSDSPSIFLNNELPRVHEIWTDSYLDYFLERVKVLWIIDDPEYTWDCYFYLDYYFEDSGCKPSYLITKRPYVFVKCHFHLNYVDFMKPDQSQIQCILEHTLMNEDKAKKMIEDLNPSVYKNLLDLPLCLNLIEQIPNFDFTQLEKVEDKKLILYDVTLQKNIHDCVRNHQETSSSLTESELLPKVDLWFRSLCRLTAEGFRDRSYVLSEDQIQFLKEECDKLNLKEDLCFSTFLNFDLNYKIRTQQEAMTVIHLRDHLTPDEQKQFFMAIPPLLTLVERFLVLGEAFNANQMMIFLHSLYSHWKRDSPETNSFYYIDYKSLFLYNFEDFLNWFYADIPYVEGLLEELSQVISKIKMKWSTLMKYDGVDLLKLEFNIVVVIDLGFISAEEWTSVINKLKSFPCKLHLCIDNNSQLPEIEDPSLFSSIDVDIKYESTLSQFLEKMFPNRNLRKVDHLIIRCGYYKNLPSSFEFEWPRKVTYHLRCVHSSEVLHDLIRFTKAKEVIFESTIQLNSKTLEDIDKFKFGRCHVSFRHNYCHVYDDDDDDIELTEKQFEEFFMKINCEVLKLGLCNIYGVGKPIWKFLNQRLHHSPLKIIFDHCSRENNLFFYHYFFNILTKMFYPSLMPIVLKRGIHLPRLRLKKNSNSIPFIGDILT